METIVFAGISLVLLIPIVYVLPLSLTFKGKLVIIGGAVAVSLAGLVVANNYPLWQALLLLTLLLFFALFLIGKKIEPLMLSNQEEASDFYERYNDSAVLIETSRDRASLSKIEESEAEQKEKMGYESSEHHVAVSKERVQETEEEQEFADDEIVVFEAEFLDTRTNDLEEVESISEIEVPVKSEISDIEKLLEEDFMEPVTEETESIPEIEVPVKSEINDIEGLLEEDFMEPVTEETESIPEIEVPAKREISDIEKLLEEDFMEPVTEETESIPEIEMPVKGEISDIERLLEEDFMEPVTEETESIPEIEMPMKNDLSEIEKLLDDEHLELEIDEESDPIHLEEMEELAVLPEECEWVTEVIEPENDTETIEVNTAEEKLDFHGYLESNGLGENPEEPGTLENTSDETGSEDSQEMNVEEPDIQLEDSLEPESLLEIPEALVLEIDKAKEEQESSSVIAKPEETTLESPTEHVSELQQQMFQTMVSHIQIAQHQLNDSEFEQLVMSHLHPEIPDQQYYIFASFLIQTYITAKKTEKLRELIVQLKEKFSAHPILLEELAFMENRFC
ncbi:hypothetical protein ACIQXQ_13860 [Peribacillus sp. NPDC097198]|uniref:hypothetical protein n=1 Tax=Peribacillus sp. NPDC097198 TaxID=3364397 RepID=UPI0038280947